MGLEEGWRGGHIVQGVGYEGQTDCNAFKFKLKKGNIYKFIKHILRTMLDLKFTSRYQDKINDWLILWRDLKTCI